CPTASSPNAASSARIFRGPWSPPSTADHTDAHAHPSPSRRCPHRGVAPPEFALCNPGALCYSPLTPASCLLPGSSAVEQPAVNRLVDGSNPSRGAPLQPARAVRLVSMLFP